MTNFRRILFVLTSMLGIIKSEEINDPNDLNKSVFSTIDENGNPIWVRLSPENAKVMSQNIHTSPVYGDALAHKLVPIQVISILGTPTMTNKTGEAQFLYEIPYAVQNAALMILAMAVKNGTPTAHNFLGDAFTSRFKYPQKAEECGNGGSNRKSNSPECTGGFEKVIYNKTIIDGVEQKDDNNGQEKIQKQQAPAQNNSSAPANNGEKNKSTPKNEKEKPEDESTNSNSNSTDEEDSTKKKEESSKENKKKPKEDQKDESSEDREEDSKSKNNLFGRSIKSSILNLPITN